MDRAGDPARRPLVVLAHVEGDSFAFAKQPCRGGRVELGDRLRLHQRAPVVASREASQAPMPPTRSVTPAGRAASSRLTAIEER